MPLNSYRNSLRGISAHFAVTTHPLWRGRPS